MPAPLADYAVLPLPLTPIEAEDLHDYEATIQRGLDTFYEVGNAFVAIKQKRLYRADYRTFEEYCREKWHIDRRYADRMIEAAEVRENLGPIGPVLEKESHARALVGLEPDQQRQVMQRALETAPNGKVTAQHIKEVRQAEIQMPAPEPQPVAAPVHQVSVCIPTTPVYESRDDWICDECQYHFNKDCWGFFYASGRSTCRACAVKSDPCAVCKSGHAHCDGCCHQCKHPCNVKQDCRRQEREETEAKRRDFGPCAKCGNQLTGPGTFWYDDRHQEQAICDACFNLDRRDPCVTCKNSHPPCPGCCNQCKRDCNVRQDCQLLDDPGEREPDAVIIDDVGPEPIENEPVTRMCLFCGDRFEPDQVYTRAENNFMNICQACASKALHLLSEDDVFAWHTEDRERICNAGLRIFRVAWGDPRENRLEIREYLPPKGSSGSHRSWQIAERFTSKADLKRRIKELDQDELTIFEHRSNS